MKILYTLIEHLSLFCGQSKSVKVNNLDKNAAKRVWVRSEKDILENNKNSQYPDLIAENSEVTNLTKKDIMIEDNN